ncbi:DUF3841 domain-containing protein, partial [Pseudomonas viridiflava]|uniref:DUF3841 domain-containing protein n=1 Tax=Pseudomonas viridiflava TaxID=33069 RepID=UPI000F01AB57
DFHYWHYALNYWAIANSTELSEAYEKALEDLGFNYYRQKPLPTPHHEHIQASWRQIFDLTYNQLDEPPEPLESRLVQAVLWELYREHIVRIYP